MFVNVLAWALSGVVEIKLEVESRVEFRYVKTRSTNEKLFYYSTHYLSKVSLTNIENKHKENIFYLLT